MCDKGVHGKKFSLEEQQQQKKMNKKAYSFIFYIKQCPLNHSKVSYSHYTIVYYVISSLLAKNQHFFHIYYNFFLFFCSFSYNSSVMLKFAHIQLSHGQITNT